MEHRNGKRARVRASGRLRAYVAGAHEDGDDDSSQLRLERLTLALRSQNKRVNGTHTQSRGLPVVKVKIMPCVCASCHALPEPSHIIIEWIASRVGACARATLTRHSLNHAHRVPL